MSDLDPIKVEALARHEAHLNHPTHRPLSDGYELVGLRGEEELTRRFGGVTDLSRRPNGDGGVDKLLTLRVPYKVDIKTARKPWHLIVEVGKVRRWTIYILARYDDSADAVTLLRWEWGHQLLKAPTKDFGFGVINHFIPYADLRELSELEEKMVQ